MKDHVNIKGVMTFTTRNAAGEIVRQVTKENLVTTRGRNVIARHLSADTTYSLEVTHGALGSSSTAPTNGDTALGTETVRIATSSATVTDNICYLSFFYPAGTGTGAYEEFGTFCDGTASADSGRIFSHVLMSGTKAATESLTVDVTYTIT